MERERPPSTTDAIFLTVEDLAQRWHKSEHTIRSDAHRAPGKLPPICRLPGQNRLLWRVVDVETYEAGHVVVLSPPPPSRRRGRPTKAEQRAARQAGAGTVGGVREPRP